MKIFEKGVGFMGFLITLVVLYLMSLIGFRIAYLKRKGELKNDL